MTDTETVQPARQRRNAIIAIAAILTIGAAAGGYLYLNRDQNVPGVLTVHGCEVFTDVRTGTTVTLRGDSGTELDRDRLVSDGESEAHMTGRPHVDCKFRFELNAPKGHDIYTVEVSGRGERSFTWDELTPTIRMTLGS